MKIIKKGKTIPFICNSCECQFVIGIRSVEAMDGNFYADCPMCGFNCHTDIGKIEMYKSKQKNKNCN